MSNTISTAVATVVGAAVAATVFSGSRTAGFANPSTSVATTTTTTAAKATAKVATPSASATARPARPGQPLALRTFALATVHDIMDRLQRLHPKCPDVRAVWEAVHNPHDGLVYVLKKTDPVTMRAKLRTFAGIHAKGRKLVAAVARRWGDTSLAPVVERLHRFMHDPHGVSRFSECDTALGANACAIAISRRDKVTGLWTSVVVHDYPLCDNAVNTNNWKAVTPPESNQYDAFLHELGHVGLPDHGHDLAWCELVRDLRLVANELKQRTFNARYRCKDECANCPSGRCDKAHVLAYSKANRIDACMNRT